MPYYFEVLPCSGRNKSVVRRYDMSRVRQDVAERFFQRLHRVLNHRRYYLQETESARRLPRVRKPVYNK